MPVFPDVITHNYHPARGAFQNICNLPEVEAESILAEIRATSNASLRSNYLQRRFAVEEWLFEDSRRKLGRTPLSRPIYFFLGNFDDGRDASRPKSHVLPLALFPPETLTFTFPDSMASYFNATRNSHLPDRKEYHGNVFTLGEIKDVVARFWMPSKRCTAEPSMNYDRFIEVQVWDDRPLKSFLYQQ